MDFSQHYFAGAPAQPYQFIGIPPLTPSHSNSAASEEFNNTSPPDAFENFQNADQFNGYDQGYAQFNQSHQPFARPPGPPTPPTNPLHARNQVQQPPPQPQPGLSNGSSGKGNSSDLVPTAKADPDSQSGRAGSNSDDEDVTPAQSRRKAQNRAAQRAFRERKERHVKDLEAKLASLEASQQQTASENERLKRDLQKAATENEILRATSAIQQQNGSMSPNSAAPTTTGPMQYNPTDFYSDLLANHTNKFPSHRIVESDVGQRLLAAGATWEFIIGHDLFKRGLVDVGDVSDRLKGQAKCDGQGPVFEERAIIEAIEQSVASGSDELL